MTYRLAVRRRGRTGTPIVLLHGLGASGRSWRLVADQLSTAASVICPDLLGFGASPRPHQRWMDVFLGHLSTHFIPGRNITWYVIFLACSAICV